MQLIIPDRFQKYLNPCVKSLLNSDFINCGTGIDTYFSTTPYYFPEYTIHGTEHINNVLKFADKLIPDETLLKEINEDRRETAISLLVLAIVLHDLGMFIKPAGLKFLIGDGEQKSRDYQEWKLRWDEHIASMKHASGNTLQNVFGDEEVKFDINSNALCADFIRKHHHQLAYQIAIEGFPGVKLNEILKSINNSNFVELAGIIALSHGVSLRNQELQKMIDKFGYEDDLPLNVPVYYLMAVLRMADLLDANLERAPLTVFYSDNFQSEYSQSEWETNQNISDFQWTIAKEKLHVITSPKESRQYVKLKSWIDYWQLELDLSWALICEKYGNKYSISIRRITSSLDNTEKYDFVTQEMRINVNPDITKLLIEPLYGNDSKYGVRELLQNSIDACNERKVIDQTEGNIIVTVDTENKLFVIKDNGIGMTEYVIKNYYLTAGASYRESSEWCDRYLDNERNAQYARSGRFGIGALAAFLIGHKVSVTTKSINEKFGYYFEYTLKSDILNVKKIKDAEIGTEIRIEISDNCLASLGEDISSITSAIQNQWFNQYQLKIPDIKYILNGKEKQPHMIFDLKKGEDSNGWFSHDLPNLDSFHWSFSNPKSLYNGIVIDSKKAIDENVLKKCGYFCGKFPRIAISDSKNTVNIDLSHNSITSPISISDSFITELCKYRIAAALFRRNPSEGKSRGFIPNDFSFLNNTCDEKIIVCLRKKSDISDIFEIDEDSRFIFFPQNIYNMIHDTPSIKEIYRFEPYLTNRFFPSLILEEEKNHNNIELPSFINQSDVKFYAKYDPNAEKNDCIMLEILQYYIPPNINNGWIPYNMEQRQEMYPKAFSDLQKYKDVAEIFENSGWYVEE